MLTIALYVKKSSKSHRKLVFLSRCTQDVNNNKHKKSSRSVGPACIFVAETKLNNLAYFVYTLSAVCTVQLITMLASVEVALTILKTENTQIYTQILRQIHTHTHKGSYEG